MKKVNLIIFAIGLVLITNAQKNETVISELSIDGIHFENYIKQTKNSEEYTYMVQIQFRDIAFKRNRNEYMYFKNAESLKKFTMDLKAAERELVLNEQKGISKWGHRQYYIEVNDIDNSRIYISPNSFERAGHTVLKKDKIQKVINYLETAQFETLEL